MTRDAPKFDPQPIVLEGEFVRLEPLDLSHVDDLALAARDPGIWLWLNTAPPKDRADMDRQVRKAVETEFTGVELPFAIIEKKTGKAVGSTRYLNIDRPNRACEIGWTWLAKDVQRTAVNTEAKFLLMRHAFETLGALRIYLRTDGRNLKSQRAIERLGATKEGVFRKERINWDGFVRDAVFYSILDDEWPRVKDALLAKLAR